MHGYRSVAGNRIEIRFTEATWTDVPELKREMGGGGPLQSDSVLLEEGSQKQLKRPDHSPR
ncbi:hypothetical protein FA13DRAFT_1744253, partial [Coprinellus micaceus]